MSTSKSNPARRKSIFATSLANPSTVTPKLSETSAQAIELEKLEQEITLTLQSIDQSFAKSHKIINEKLIPVVNRYHLSSKKIWSGVTFWKNFLENSANVELKAFDEAVTYQTDDSISRAHDSNSTIIPAASQDTNQDFNIALSPVRLNNQPRESTNYNTIDFQKRYENNYNPIMPTDKGTRGDDDNMNFDTTDSILPSLPNIVQGGSYDQLLHNGPDVNYKIQMTPRRENKRTIGAVNSVTPKARNKKRKSSIIQQFDSSPGSDIEAPRLNSDVNYTPNASPYGSPKQKKTPKATSTTGDDNEDGETQRFPKDRTPKIAQRYNITDDSHDISVPVMDLNFADAAGRNIRRSPAKKVANSFVSKVLQDVSGLNDSGDPETLDFDQFLDTAVDKEKNKENEAGWSSEND